MNREWHAANRMPRNANTQQRLAWHLEHQKHCNCRPMPRSLQDAANRAVAQSGKGGD